MRRISFPQASLDSWCVKYRRKRRSLVTQETCSKPRRRSCMMSTRKETPTSTRATCWASIQKVSSTFKIEWETLSGENVFCFSHILKHKNLHLNLKFFIYFIVNRWKGENVSTAEVADILTQFDGINEANVYGVEVPGNCFFFSFFMLTSECKLKMQHQFSWNLTQLPQSYLHFVGQLKPVSWSWPHLMIRTWRHQEFSWSLQTFDIVSTILCVTYL